MFASKPFVTFQLTCDRMKFFLVHLTWTLLSEKTLKLGVKKVSDPNKLNITFYWPIWNQVQCRKTKVCCNELIPTKITLIDFSVEIFCFPQVTNLNETPLSLTHWHAHQRHYKKTRRLLSMQHKLCTTQVGPFFLRNYETNVLLDLKKWTHDKTHFIKQTEEEGKIFFHII